MADDSTLAPRRVFFRCARRRKNDLIFFRRLRAAELCEAFLRVERRDWLLLVPALFLVLYFWCSIYYYSYQSPSPMGLTSARGAGAWTLGHQANRPA